jgi:hypothetical protein
VIKYYVLTTSFAMSKRPWTIFILLVCVLAPNSSV